MREKYCSLAEKVRLISQANRALHDGKKLAGHFHLILSNRTTSYCHIYCLNSTIFYVRGDSIRLIITECYTLDNDLTEVTVQTKVSSNLEVSSPNRTRSIANSCTMEVYSLWDSCLLFLNSLYSQHSTLRNETPSKNHNIHRIDCDSPAFFWVQAKLSICLFPV